ncbi:DUF397 domain-containing protein [Streptomyces sp. NPDC046805]|uniref:DUF397 domain-containing protein n=1 Tax=Streptomyces sp. NPDC046805 TaxID=3155134 RepID=UPI0033E8757B
MNSAETASTTPTVTWFKSSYSGAEGGQCVEVASATGAVYVRDSKNVVGPVLTASPAAWAHFVELASGAAA